VFNCISRKVSKVVGHSTLDILTVALILSHSVNMALKLFVKSKKPAMKSSEGSFLCCKSTTKSSG